MNILAICARLSPEVKIITYELMTNHFHLTVEGRRDEVEKMVSIFIRALFKYFKAQGMAVDLSGFTPSMREIKTLQDLRNVIVYNNRNGYIVSPDETPFSYKWGANTCYFNPAQKQLFAQSRASLSARERRFFARTHEADTIEGIITVDGCACPMSFCAISFGESLFRGASHYFRELSRNIESQKTIAAEIGESIFYTDDELFSVVLRVCKEKYGQSSPGLLPAQAKRELAALLHYDYNAGNKQIRRMLRLDPQIVASLFPERH